MLDLGLPDVDGMVLLQHLKRHPDTRHIPVQVVVRRRPAARQHGARAPSATCEKPLDRGRARRACWRASSSSPSGRVRSLLLVEDDAAERDAIAELLGGDDVEIRTAATTDEALAALREQPRRRASCSTSGCPGSGPFELLEEMSADDVAGRRAGHRPHRPRR